MEPQPSQYPSAPQPATPGDLAPPPNRIHSLTGVVLATFCGMPLGGSVVLAINYWRWGQKAYAVAVVTGGLLTTAVIAWFAFVLPAAVPALAFLVPQPVIAYVAGRWLQGHRIDAHRAAGGARVSPGIDALIGLGASSIGQTPEGYVQNVPATAEYQRRVTEGRLATERGFELGRDDRIRGRVIELLMCDFAFSFAELTHEFGPDANEVMEEAVQLAEAENDGLVELTDGLFQLTEKGRPFVRSIASAFDTYLQTGKARHSLAV